LDGELFEQIVTNAQPIDGKYVAQIKTMESNVQFSIVANDFRSMRYAAALLASGDTQMSEALLTEH
jgi:hypothetical protein